MTGVGDLAEEVLADLVLAGDLAGPVPDLAGPFSRPASAEALILARSVSVAASSASRLRARSAARAGLRQQISRSPG